VGILGFQKWFDKDILDFQMIFGVNILAFWNWAIVLATFQ
jgi:hypothetical protein